MSALLLPQRLERGGRACFKLPYIGGIIRGGSYSNMAEAPSIMDKQEFLINGVVNISQFLKNRSPKITKNYMLLK
jgi:hypothetical protein